MRRAFSRSTKPLRSGNPQEVWGAFCGGSVGAPGQPQGIQIDEGGEWKKEVRADLSAGCRVKLQFPGVSARHSILERRNGLARGIYNRPDSL